MVITYIFTLYLKWKKISNYSEVLNLCNCFISTVKKQGKNVLDYLSLAICSPNATKNILLTENGG